MKKCPKCLGKGIIQNYIMIDGGKCYECNGQQWVNDHHKLSKPYREYEPPKWLIEKENRIMDESYKINHTVMKRIKSISKISAVNVYDCEDIRTLIEGYSNKDLIEMDDQQFHNVVLAAHEEVKELLSL
ncbi:hypothetical protein EBB07_29350 [Paenibacillaceae bacterium]|nr:hypothetical protein EBB07_29350 [Paenibacillaceae bacterium]